MSATNTRVCGSCGGQIGWMEEPPLIPGFTANCWEGWFHLDARREHFGRVGWTGVNFATGSEPPHVTAKLATGGVVSTPVRPFVQRVEQRLKDSYAALDAAIAQRNKAERKRDELRSRNEAWDKHLVKRTRERDLARAELANLGRELAEARATIRALTRTQGADT